MQKLGEYLKRYPDLLGVRITFLEGTPDRYMVLLDVQEDDEVYTGVHPSLPLALAQAIKKYDQRD
jgi:hypothetical protein